MNGFKQSRYWGFAPEGTGLHLHPADPTQNQTEYNISDQGTFLERGDEWRKM
jgi:hypothetical protein